MKFSAKEDIEAPIADVFAMLSEFEDFERSAMRRGAEVQRTSDHQTPTVGMTWDIAFQLRGRRRQMALLLTEFDGPTKIKVDASSANLSSVFLLTLMELSPVRTRVAVELDLKPQNLSARLLIQSLKLAKTQLIKRFKMRVAEYAREIEQRYKKAS